MAVLDAQTADKFGYDNLKGNTGKNFADPIQAQDAATKNYVDGEIAAIPSPTVPVKATGAEINTGTDDAKFATAKAITDSNIAFISDIRVENLVNPYKARAYRATNISNLSANFNKVTLDTESYDVNGNFDNATNYRYTAPVTGYYAVSASIRFETWVDQTRVGACVYKNGSLWNLTTGSNSGANNNSVTFTDIIYLTATQYLELFYYNDTGATTIDIEGGEGRTFMAVHLLSV